MADLNVRQRRLETKIAFIGPALAGKNTNLSWLGGAASPSRQPTVGDDGLLSLAWRPKNDTTFRDCEVHVRIVATNSPAEISSAVDKADAIVFVASAGANDQSVNQQTLEALRELVGSGSGGGAAKGQPPIVLQVNKTDLPDAVSASTIAGALGFSSNSSNVVSACAIRGEGVEETMERALNAVLDQLGREEVPAAPPAAAANTNGDRVSGPGGASSPMFGAAPSLPREGNPLLNALKHVLRETVSAQVAELESHLETRCFQPMLETLSKQRTDFVALRDRVDALARDVKDLKELSEEAAKSSAGTTEAAATIRSTRDAVLASLSGVKKSMEALVVETKTMEASLEVIAHETKAIPAKLEPRFEEVKAKTVDATNHTSTKVRKEVAGIVPVIEDAHTDTARGLGEVRSAVDTVQTTLNLIIEEMNKPKKGWFG